MFVRTIVDRVNHASFIGRGREQNGGAAEIAADLENISGAGLHRFPEQRGFIETLANQTAIAAIAGEKPRQIFEGFSWNRFPHCADESLSRRAMQDTRLAVALAKARRSAFVFTKTRVPVLK